MRCHYTPKLVTVTQVPSNTRVFKPFQRNHKKKSWIRVTLHCVHHFQYNLLNIRTLCIFFLSAIWSIGHNNHRCNWWKTIFRWCTSRPTKEAHGALIKNHHHNNNNNDFVRQVYIRNIISIINIIFNMSFAIYAHKFIRFHISCIIIGRVLCLHETTKSHFGLAKPENRFWNLTRGTFVLSIMN